MVILKPHLAGRLVFVWATHMIFNLDSECNLEAGGKKRDKNGRAMVLILDGNSLKFAHAKWKIGLFRVKTPDLSWLSK